MMPVKVFLALSFPSFKILCLVQIWTFVSFKMNNVTSAH